MMNRVDPDRLQAPDEPPAAHCVASVLSRLILGQTGRTEPRLRPGDHLGRKGLVAQKELALPQGMNCVTQHRIRILIGDVAKARNRFCCPRDQIH